MKLPTLLTAFLLSALSAFAQTDTIKVPFVAYWSLGDSYNFKVTKIKQQWKEGVQTANDSSAYLANFKVIDSTESSFKIQWSFKTNLTEYNIPEAMLDKFSKYKMTEVIYQTTEVGEFVGIENWEDVSKMMNNLLTDMVDILSAEKGLDKAEFNKSMVPFRTAYGSKEGIEQLVFKELHYFHFPFGVEFAMGESLVYEELLPNMFGGNPIRGESTVALEYVDEENAYCVLKHDMKLNPDDTKELITALFKQMDVKTEEMLSVMKTAKFDISDSNTYEYVYDPGVPFKIEAKRETLVDIAQEKGRRLDITRIELVD